MSRPWLAGSIALLALAIVGTGGAEAAGNLVSIVDKRSGAAAKVLPGGDLSVGDGKGPMTVDGTVRVGDGSGPVTVDGRVSSALPSTMALSSAVFSIIGGEGCSNLFYPLPEGQPFLLERVAVHITNVAPTDRASAGLTFYTKSGGQTSIARIEVPVTSPVRGGAAGSSEVGLVLRGSSSELTAAEGDVYKLVVCFGRGASASPNADGRITLIGRR